MGRPNVRLNAEHAKAKGLADRRKGEYGGREYKSSSAKIGGPSPWMNDVLASHWYQFVNEAPYLRENHRALVELACDLRDQLTRGIAGRQERAQFIQVLRSLGMTPVDEARVATHLDEDDEDDEFA